jgi:nucleoside-diphosphate-sugar epimerase
MGRAEAIRLRVLVTGGTGFVGSHSVRALRAAGHSLRLLARSREKVERVFPDGVGEIVVGDVTDASAVAKALDGVDAVVHCAAVVAIEARRAHEVRDTNLRSVELVVGGAADRGVGAIVYVSSLGALFAPGAPLSEQSPIAAAQSPYARSKAEGEIYVRRLQASGAPIRTVYPPGIIGPDDPGLSEGNHTVGVFLNQLMADTSSGFEIVDVRDLAALIAALVEPSAAPGRYVVSGAYLPWRDTIVLMDELTGRRVRRVRVPGALLRRLGRLGDLVKHVFPFDFPLSAEAMDFATQWPGVIPSPAIAALGVRFRDARETYIDTIRWLYRAGHLTRKQAGKLAD